MATHTVTAGQTLAHVAYEHRVSQRSILDAPENAELFQRREPHLLCEGDELFIPDDPPKQIELAVGRAHLLEYRPARVPLRVRFVRAGAPRSFESCEYSVDGQPAVEARLDEEGWLSLRVPVNATRVELELSPGTPFAEARVLEVGQLDPHHEPRGVQQRLNNLGYDCGAEDGDLGDKTRAALEAYQAVHGLACTGEADEATKAHLADRHRS